MPEPGQCLWSVEPQVGLSERLAFRFVRSVDAGCPSITNTLKCSKTRRADGQSSTDSKRFQQHCSILSALIGTKHLRVMLFWVKNRASDALLLCHPAHGSKTNRLLAHSRMLAISASCTSSAGRKVKTYTNLELLQSSCINAARNSSQDLRRHGSG